jgi:tetratricopeptide (TPR) repeat protein
MRAVLMVLALTLVAPPAWAQTTDESFCMGADLDLKIEGCTGVIQSVLETRKAHAIAYSNRGAAYADKGLYDKAIADLTQAIALAPSDADAYNGRAWAYHLEREDAKGLPDAEKAVSLAPDDADSLDTRAEIYERLGRRAEAIADYRKVLKLASPASQAGGNARSGLKRLGAEAQGR